MAASEPDQLVLDDELFILYTRFNSGVNTNDLDKNTLYALLSRLKLPYKYGPEQVLRCRDELPESFMAEIAPQILAGGTTGQTLEDMALQTIHRVILTTKSNTFPYVHIRSPKLDTNFSITVPANSPRTELQNHIRSLLQGATCIHIYDQYLHGAIDRGSFSLQSLLPDTSIKIFCHDMPQIKKGKKATKKLHKKVRPNFFTLRAHCAQHQIANPLTFASHSYEDMHDRYLIIEYPTHSYEIILSSGFEYLFSDKKEITCVFRKK